MCEDRRRIYQLIDMYLTEAIDDESFCDEFVPLYNVEIDYDCLTNDERKSFSALMTVASRFSEFEEDHQKVPGFFYTKEQLRKKIKETKEKLSRYFAELENSKDGSEI